MWGSARRGRERLPWKLRVPPFAAQGHSTRTVFPKNPLPRLLRPCATTPTSSSVLTPLTKNRTKKEQTPHKVPSHQFQALLTPCHGCFSSFPHGTFSLLVTLSYLALEGIYLPLSAAIPNNTTLGFPRFHEHVESTGLSPSGAPRSSGLDPTHSLAPEPQTTTPRLLPKAGIPILGWSRFTRSY